MTHTMTQSGITDTMGALNTPPGSPGGGGGAAAAAAVGEETMDLKHLKQCLPLVLTSLG
jgi:hypothetical protein